MLGSQSFFDRREVRDIIAYLKWIDQPGDEVSLLRVVNTPPRGLGNKTMKLLVDRAVQRGVPVWDVMQDRTAIADLTPAARRGIDQLTSMAGDVRQRASADSLADAMRTLLERSAYADEIARLYEQPEERGSADVIAGGN